MPENKFFRFYYNVLVFFVTFSGTALLLTWIYKTIIQVYKSEPTPTVHLDIVIPSVENDTTISTTAERALGYSMNIWQNTVENLGNDIATLEISLSIAGIVIAFLVALAGYYLNKLVENNTKEIENNKLNFQNKISTLEEDYQEISSSYQNLVGKLKPGIDNIGKSITLNQVFSRNPYYNNGVLSFYALLIEWKRLLNTDEDELDDKENFLLGCYNYSRDNFIEAQHFFDKVQKNPSSELDMHINFYLGLLHDDQRNFEQAISYYSKEIEQNTAFKSLSYSNRGFTFLEQAKEGDKSKFEMAKLDFEKAISTSNKQIDPYPHYGIAICIFEQQGFAEIEKIKAEIEVAQNYEMFHDSIKENYSRKQFKSMEAHINAINSKINSN